MVKFPRFVIVLAMTITVITGSAVRRSDTPRIMKEGAVDNEILESAAGLELLDSEKGVFDNGIADIVKRFKLIVCESIRYKPKKCNVGGTIQKAVLYKKLSMSPCTRRVSYSFGSSTIYVSKGCRASFVVVLKK